MRSSLSNLIRQWSWMLWPCSLLLWAWWLFMVVPVSASAISAHSASGSRLTWPSGPATSQGLHVILPTVSEPVALSGTPVAGDDWKQRRVHAADRLAPYQLTWQADYRAAMYGISVMF